jgi:hypothetical protein
MSRIREYILKNYESDTIKDIVNHGMVSGFAGLTYYSETCEFHDDYENEIWDFLYEDAQSMDMNIPELIASFNGSKNVGSLAQFKNLLCWYAVEREAGNILAGLEHSENCE